MNKSQCLLNIPIRTAQTTWNMCNIRLLWRKNHRFKGFQTLLTNHLQTLLIEQKTHIFMRREMQHIRLYIKLWIGVHHAVPSTVQQTYHPPQLHIRFKQIRLITYKAIRQSISPTVMPPCIQSAIFANCTGDVLNGSGYAGSNPA